MPTLTLIKSITFRVMPNTARAWRPPDADSLTSPLRFPAKPGDNHGFKHAHTFLRMGDAGSLRSPSGAPLWFSIDALIVCRRQPDGLRRPALCRDNRAENHARILYEGVSDTFRSGAALGTPRYNRREEWPELSPEQHHG